jgi:hypothetical protein
MFHLINCFSVFVKSVRSNRVAGGEELLGRFSVCFVSVQVRVARLFFNNLEPDVLDSVT